MEEGEPLGEPGESSEMIAGSVEPELGYPGVPETATVVYRLLETAVGGASSTGGGADAGAWSSQGAELS